MLKSEAAKLIAMLVTAFPDGLRFLDEEQRTETKALYRTMMLDLDYEIGNLAITRIIATFKKWPQIADIRAACSRQLDGRDDRGGEAWGKLLKLIGRYGMNRRPLPMALVEPEPDTFIVDDPLLFRVIDAFGWRELCSSENQTADRARVIELYEQLALQASEDRSVRKIAAPIPRKHLERGGGRLGDIVPNLLPDKVPT